MMAKVPFYQELEAKTTILNDDVRQQIYESINKAYEQTMSESSSFTQRSVKGLPWYLLLVMCLFIFPLIFYLVVRNFAFQKLLRNIAQHLDLAHLHKVLWSQTKLPAPASVETTRLDDELEKYHRQIKGSYGVPISANISQRSHAFQATLFCGIARYQNIVWHWVTETEGSDGKKREEHHYKPITTIWFDLPEASELQFYWQFHQLINWNHQLTKVTLESSDFNNIYILRASDQVRIRMVFTPLMMVLAIDNAHVLKPFVRSWRMHKNPQRFVINYVPRKLNHLCVSTSVFSMKQQSLPAKLSELVGEHFWEFYVAFRMILITNYY